MKSWKSLVAAGVVAAAVSAAIMLVVVLACGPDFESEVFVPKHHPDTPTLYADGHLGVLQHGYFHAELVIAYRYLSGSKLSEAEKHSYVSPDTSQPHYDTPQAELPTSRWLAARAAVQTPVPDSLLQQYKVTDTQRQGYVGRDERLNCPDAAFKTAIDTLMLRTKTWGANSEDLKEWTRGQDAVFSNCEKAGAAPDPAKPGWSTLLKQDRAYQIAAAQFYREDFDSARDGFVAIGKDRTSPWSRWGEYLAARADVRKSSVPGMVADIGDAAHFDKDLLVAAQTRLLKLQHETRDAEISHAADAELGFIDVRLVPEKRLDQVSVALAGPKPDPEFTQDLIDLDFLMDRNVVGDSDLVLWIRSMEAASPAPPSTDPQFPMSQWNAKHSLPWMVAAFPRAPKDASNDLMDAAAKLKPGSPGFETVSYYRANQLLSAGSKAEARSLLDSLLAGLGPETMPSTRNEFLSQRIQTAHNLDQFLADAPRTVIAAGSEAAAALCNGKGWSRDGCNAKIPLEQFDADVATSLNTKMPLSMWQQAAYSSTLPKNLRNAVAWAAWMRALGLADVSRVERMSALLPESVRKTAGDSDGFPATLALLRNPGLRPYLQQGVQRSATYAQMGEFSDSWWCGRWTDGFGNGRFVPEDKSAASASPVEFLTASEKKQAADEAARLNALPSGAVWLGRRAIAYVKAHPEDEDAAEALGLTVRATHTGCSNGSGEKDKSAVSKEAFEMLHRKYPNSEWAAKTKYYY